MSLGSVGDKFGTASYNFLKTGGYADPSAMGEQEIRKYKEGSVYRWKTSESGVEKQISPDHGGKMFILKNYGGI